VLEGRAEICVLLGYLLATHRLASHTIAPRRRVAGAVLPSRD